MKRLRWILMLPFISVLLSTEPFAQTAGSVTLSIRFQHNIAQFHVGEIIPIELSFTSSRPDTFFLDTRSYDRSGRLDLESFHVAPAGRDPLRDYYLSSSGFIGGGMGGVATLSDAPQILREDLNEWVALDQPGHYSLSVTTQRVSRQVATKTERVELQSNLLDFDVIAANPSWMQSAVSAATASLDNPSAGAEEKTAALRSLRFLDSPASISELVQNLGRSEGNCWDCVAGLSGSRHPVVVVSTLQRQFDAPDFALTGDYLSLLARLQTQLDRKPLPPYPEHDEKEQAAWIDHQHKQVEAMAQLEDDLYRRAAASVRKKRQEAKAETIRTLLVRPARTSAEISPLASLSGDEVAEAFLLLSEDQQDSLLTIFGQRLNLPAMVRPLVQIAERPQLHNGQLRDSVLRRLYELDATAGTLLLLSEIRSPHVDGGMFTVKGRTLGVLPNKTLPQFDQLLAMRLEQPNTRTGSLDAQLVGRYATEAVLGRIKQVYLTNPRGTGDCVTDDGLILYFLRVDADYGIDRLKQAPSVCMTSSMPAAVKMKRWKDVEPAVIAELANSDLNRARQAAETLAKYGGPKAEAALWARMKSFHKQWAERQSDFVPRTNQPRDIGEATSLQYGLVQSIGTAQGWILTEEQVRTLESLTLGQERDNVTSWHWKPPLSLSLNVYFDGQLHADINQQYFPADLDALKRKLAQFPSGTHFLVTTFGNPQQLEPVMHAVHEVAADHHLDIEAAP